MAVALYDVVKSGHRNKTFSLGGIILNIFKVEKS